MADLDQGSHEIPDHPIEKAVAGKTQLQNISGLLADADGAEPANGGCALVSRVGGKGGEIVFSHEKPGGLTHGLEIKGAGHVPGPPDFHGVKKGTVSDAVQVGFSAGGKTSMEFRFVLLNGQDADTGRKVEIQGAKENLWGVRGRKLDRGRLSKGVDTTVSPSGSGNRERLPEDFFEGGFEGKLDGGMGILPLPAVKVLTAVRNGELKGLKLQEAERSLVVSSLTMEGDFLLKILPISGGCQKQTARSPPKRREGPLVGPDFVEDVGKADKTAIGVDTLIAGGGVGVGNVLKCTLDVEGPAFIQKEF